MIAIVRRTLGEGFEVVGAVEDGKQAVNAVLTLNTNALVIDISMPVLNGLQATKKLQTADSRAKIIFLTVYEGQDFVDAAFLRWGLRLRQQGSPVHRPHSSNSRGDVGTNLYIRVAVRRIAFAWWRAVRSDLCAPPSCR